MRPPDSPGDDAEFEELDFAKEALTRVALVAAELAARQKSCVAGCLAAQLWIATKTLDSASAAQLPKLHRRLPKLVADLERVCTWPKPSSTNSVLRSLLKAGTYRSQQEAEDQIRKGIGAFANASLAVRDGYFRKLEQFSKVAMIPKDDQARDKKAKITDTEDYPARVNLSLYSVLRKHSLCSCEQGPPKRHPARLRLRNDVAKVDGCVAFDLLFSASPNEFDYWQDLQLRVALKKKTGKSVKIAGAGHDADTDSKEGQARFKVLPPGSLCKLVTSKLGSRICCRVQDPGLRESGLQDAELQQLYDGSPIVQQADPGPSVSLRRILGTHRLSNRMKLILAYIIARSFWQYYDSPWMNTKWTSDSIHFLREPAPDDDLPPDSGVIYASRPYFVIEFDGHDDREFLEYCDSFSVIYRYPRLLALCILLIEVGRGQSLMLEDHGSMEANLNSAWTTAKQFADKPKLWGDFDYPDYRKTVLSCLDRKLFDESSPEGSKPEMDVVTRKATINKTIVQPLENMLKILGFLDSLQTLEPISSSGPRDLLRQPTLKAVSMPAVSDDSTLSTLWLNKLVNINAYIHNLTLSAAPRRPVRIAILDTGCDINAVFFDNRARSARMKGWKDFAGESEESTDENGHGTHAVTLVMKVAPTADIYVARIARDKSSLGSSVDSVVKAIQWASETCEADIVSMSFGFPSAIPAISRALDTAILHRNSRVLFVAAASNSGGNQREMFPATHPSVISIRATNSNGLFSDSNPPIDSYGPAVLGTLGKDVPSAWLSSVDGELPKSGSSVANAVAAGIAGMMLSLAGAGLGTADARVPSEVEKLWTKEGMERLLFKMGQGMGNRSFFVSPPAFFSHKDPARYWSIMADVCAMK